VGAIPSDLTRLRSDPIVEGRPPLSAAIAGLSRGCRSGCHQRVAAPVQECICQLPGHISGCRPWDPPVGRPGHDRLSTANSPASTHWFLGAFTPPTSTPIWVAAAGVSPTRPARQPMAITTRPVGALVDPGVYGSVLGASIPLNPPVQQGVNHSPSSAPSREVHKRSTASTSQVSKRPVRRSAGTRFISGRLLHSAARPQTRQEWPCCPAWSVQSDTPISAASW
jgi:hypothetical protein